jgi:hypothetical protein
MTEPIDAGNSGTGWAAPSAGRPPAPPGVGRPAPAPPGVPPGAGPTGMPRVTLPPGMRPPTPPTRSAPPTRITLPPGMSPPANAVRVAPSGLFPSGPPRPVYREPHPVRLAQVSLGALAGALWMTLFGLLAGTARAYAWWSISAGILGWLTALALGRYGLRGIAVGASITVGAALAIVGVVVMQRWLGGHWLLW